MKLDDDYEKVMKELHDNFGWINIPKGLTGWINIPDGLTVLLNDTIMAVKNLMRP
jgi:hypothetical protein